MPKTSKIAPGIDLRGKGRYRARVTFEGRPVSVGVFPTKRIAVEQRTQALAEIARGTFVPPSVARAREKAEAKALAEQEEAASVTVAEVAEEWFAWQERRGLAHGTIRARRASWRSRIEPVFGDRPIRDVTEDEVDAWFYPLRAEKWNLARNCYAALSNLMAYAAGTARGTVRGFTPYIDVTPCVIPDGSNYSEPKDDRRKIATTEEVAALAEGMPPRYRMAVLIAGLCGLRQGEVLELRRKDITSDPVKEKGMDPQYWIRIERQVLAKDGGGQYVAAPKSSAGVRTVPVPAALVSALKDHLKRHAGFDRRNGLLFPRNDRGDQWTSAGMLSYYFRRALKGYNDMAEKEHLPTLGGFKFHALRHTCLTRVGQAGATTAELMAWAGHSDPQTVVRYQHAERDRLATLSAALDVPTLSKETAAVTPITSARSRSTKSA